LQKSFASGNISTVSYGHQNSALSIEWEVKDMAVAAYVLIETEVGEADDVIASLRKTKGVKCAHFTTGPYDVICEIEVEDLVDLNTIIGQRIHLIANIKKTVSCIVMDSPSVMEASL
jgi:DNA-binding Lrp family transcriptional regulator